MSLSSDDWDRLETRLNRFDDNLGEQTRFINERISRHKEDIRADIKELGDKVNALENRVKSDSEIKYLSKDVTDGLLKTHENEHHVIGWPKILGISFVIAGGIGGFIGLAMELYKISKG